MYRRGQNFRWALWLGEKLKNSVVGKSISKTNFEAKIFNFSSPAPRCTLTDRGHGGFAFFAHRHCPATQGSTFSARSGRRVQEKSTWSSSQISKRAKGSIFLARGLAWRRRVRILRVRFAPAPEGSKFRSSVRNGGPPVTIGGTTGFDIFDAPSTLVTKGSTFRTVFSLRARGFKISGWR